MLLRPRQKQFVERSLQALAEHGNALGVTPTDAGKAIMLSAAVGEQVAGSDAKALVLAHRDELTAQNRGKFRRVNPGMATSVVNASEKSWAGQVTFGMGPTLTRQANLQALPALGMTRYQASALLTFQFNRSAIRGLIMQADLASLARVA